MILLLLMLLLLLMMMMMMMMMQSVKSVICRLYHRLLLEIMKRKAMLIHNFFYSI